VIDKVRKPALAVIEDLNDQFPLGWVMFVEVNHEMIYQNEHRKSMDVDWEHNFVFQIQPWEKTGMFLVERVVMGGMTMSNSVQTVSIVKGAKTPVIGTFGRSATTSVQPLLYAYDPDNKIFVVGMVPGAPPKR
jgi:hypothetical protein